MRNPIRFALFLTFLGLFFSCGETQTQGKKKERVYLPIGVEKWLDTDMGDAIRTYYIEPKNIKKNKVLLLFHEWWGLNTDFKKVCDRFSEKLKDTRIIGVDLYDGKVATTSKEAKTLMDGITRQRANQIITGVFGFCGSDAKIATIGWAMGGSWALESAIMFNRQSAGCVMYYAMPPEHAVDLAPLTCDILAIFGNKDQFVTPAIRQQFEQNCKLVRKNLIIKTYDAKHDFANPISPNYNANAAQNAEREVIDFLRKRL